jgi:hypothetical protein
MTASGIGLSFAPKISQSFNQSRGQDKPSSSGLLPTMKAKLFKCPENPAGFPRKFHRDSSVSSNTMATEDDKSHKSALDDSLHFKQLEL